MTISIHNKLLGIAIVLSAMSYVALLIIKSHILDSYSMVISCMTILGTILGISAMIVSMVAIVFFGIKRSIQ